MDQLQLWREPPLLRSAGHFRSWNAPVAGVFKSKVRALNDCVQGVGSYEGDVEILVRGSWTRLTAGRLA